MRALQLPVLLLATVSPALSAQTEPHRPPPSIDVHWHSTLSPSDVRRAEAVNSRRAAFAALDSMNVRLLIVNGVPDAIAVWRDEYPDRVIAGLLFPCENGIAPNGGRPCYADGAVWPDTAWLREELRAKRIGFLGEVTAQYLGIASNDARLDPYYALALEYDVPVAIHLGLGPPGAAYPSSPVGVKSPNFRASAGSPLLLEDALLRHRGLRVWIMHAGWPLIDETIYMLYQHPQVYVDVGVLHGAVPRPAYRDAVRRIVEAGYANRIMLGSDSGVNAFRRALSTLEEMEFLTPEQRENIRCRNAARFFRLDSLRVCG